MTLKYKSYDELIDGLKEHLSQRPLLIVLRYRFYKREQLDGGITHEYVAAVQQLSITCGYERRSLLDRPFVGL